MEIFSGLFHDQIGYLSAITVLVAMVIPTFIYFYIKKNMH